MNSQWLVRPAITLAQRYAYEKGVDTIVCLDGSEVIGAFLARHLSKNDYFSINRDKNINVVTPEYDSNGQLIFRDNLTPMISGKDVLILISTVNSGKTAAVPSNAFFTTAAGFRELPACSAPSPLWRKFRSIPSSPPPTSPDMQRTPSRSVPCAGRDRKSTLFPTATDFLFFETG